MKGVFGRNSARVVLCLATSFLQWTLGVDIVDILSRDIASLPLSLQIAIPINSQLILIAYQFNVSSQLITLT